MNKIKNSDLPVYKLSPKIKEYDLSLFKKSGLTGRPFDPKGIKVNKDEYCKSKSYIKVINNPKFKHDDTEHPTSTKRSNADKNISRPNTAISRPNTNLRTDRLLSPSTNRMKENIVKKANVNELSFFKI